MIDPPPFASQVMNYYKISVNLIDKLIITNNCYSNNGIVTKLLTNDKVDLYTTRIIMDSFIDKYKLLTDYDTREIESFYNFKEITVNHNIIINGATFNFFYNFNNVPTLAMTVQLENKKIFIGNGLYNLELIKEYESINNNNQPFDRSIRVTNIENYDLILINKEFSVFNNTIQNDINEKYSKNIMYYSKNSNISNILNKGFKNTYVIISQADQVVSHYYGYLNDLYILSITNLFKHLDLPKLSQLYSIAYNQTIKKDEVIITEGEIGLKFYIIKFGIVKISSEIKQIKKIISTGEYFGESILLPNSKRNASVTALSNTELFVIDKKDLFNLFIQENKILKSFKILAKKRKTINSEFINSNKFINLFSEYFKNELNFYLHEHNSSENEIFWTKNEVPQFCFFVFSGEFEISCPTIDVSNIKVKHGSFIGEFNSIINKNLLSKSSIKSKSAGKIYYISASNMRLLMEKYPRLKIALKNKIII